MPTRRRTALTATLAAIAVFLGCLCPVESNAKDEFTIGSWTGMAQVSRDGASVYCVLQQQRTSGAELFMYFGDSGLRIGLFDPEWQLPVGESHPATIRVDDRWSVSAPALMITDVTTMISLGDDPEAFDALRRGRTLIFQMPERTFRFSLEDSSAALAELRACYDRYARPAIAETPRRASDPAAGDGSSTNPFAPADPAVPGQTPSTPANPFAPVAPAAPAAPAAPRSAPAGTGPGPANPFAPAPPGIDKPSRSAAVAPPAPADRLATAIAAGARPRPRPPVDGLQRIIPYLPFDSFSLMTDLFLPGNPQAVETPGHVLSNYQVAGSTDEGRYRGFYLEAALRGAAPEELLDYLMWIEEVSCGGPSQSANRQLEHFGDKTVARETLNCRRHRDALTRTIIVSGGKGMAQIFIIEGEAPALDAAAAMYRALRGLARDG